MTKTIAELPAHSSLGASGAHMWLACPGSVDAQKLFPNVETVYSLAGTLAHAVAEQCLKNGFDALELVDRSFDINGAHMIMPPEMADPVRVYVDHCRDLMCFGDPKVTTGVETKFHLKQIDAELFGTCDFHALIMASRALHVVDYKHGEGVAVYPEENSQGLYYALGAWYELGRPALDSVNITIIQPRTGDGKPQTWTTDALRLVEFEMELRAGVKRVREERSTRVAGDHCRWCKAKAVCDAYQEHATAAAVSDFETLDNTPIDHLTPCNRTAHPT